MCIFLLCLPILQATSFASTAGVQLAEYSGEFAYGLNITPPWSDGGKLIINLPEHLEYNDNGMGILRHNDKKPNGHWEISADGLNAILDVESPTAPGVWVKGTAKVVSENRVQITMRIINGGKTALPIVKPLYCFQYRYLTGFPQWIGNFKHCYVITGGRLTALADLPTSKPETKVKGATVIACPRTHRDDWYAKRHGGHIEQGIDAAISAVTSLDGKRKLVFGWTPGKSMLSNASIPCIHADPCYGTIQPGQWAEATGVIILTEAPLEDTVADLLKSGVGAPVERSTDS